MKRKVSPKQVHDWVMSKLKNSHNSPITPIVIYNQEEHRVLGFGMWDVLTSTNEVNQVIILLYSSELKRQIRVVDDIPAEELYIEFDTYYSGEKERVINGDIGQILGLFV